MALPIYALASLAEFKQELHISSAVDSTLDPRLESVLGRASDRCERFCHCKLVYRQTPYVEYHTVKEPRSVIYLLDRPVVSISDVRESATLDWTSGAALVANSDYVASLLEGKITRTSGSVPIDWFYVGVRTIRVTYIAGYEPITVANGGAGTGTNGCPAIPDTLKSVALALAVRMWREIDRKQQGIQSLADGAGSTTRFAEAHLEDWMKDDLEPFAYEPLYPTGERDT